MGEVEGTLQDVDPERAAALTALEKLGALTGSLSEEEFAERMHEILAENPVLLETMSAMAFKLYQQGEYSEAIGFFALALDVSKKVSGAEHPDTLKLINNLAGTLFNQREYSRARELYEEALSVRRHVLGSEHPETIISMNNLAQVLKIQGDLLGARELFEEALSVRRRALGTEHPDTLAVMKDLTPILKALGELSGARELEEQAFSALSRARGPEHPDTLRSMVNMAQTLKALGELSGAQELGEEAFSALRRVLGPEHPDTLISMNNLAGILQAQGDPSGARELLAQALPALRRVLGPEDPDTLTSMNNLGAILQAQGHFSDARKLHEDTLSIRRRLLGPEHPDTLMSMSNLGATLFAQGDYSGAHELEQETLSIRRRILGSEHPDTLWSINQLADTLRTLGDLSGARKLEEEALSTQLKILGAQHPDTLKSMNNLARTLSSQGELSGARELHESTLLIRHHALGPEHPDTLTSMNNLAGILEDQGKLLRARDLYKKALPLHRRVLGPEHPDTLKVMINLAGNIQAQGDPIYASELLHEVLSISRRELGPEHPDTITAMSSLAKALRVQEELSGARKLQEEVLSIRRRVLGPEHPDTLIAINNMADTLRAQGDLSGARELQEKELSVCRRVLGPEHPSTITSMNNLAVTLSAQGDSSGARRLNEDALSIRRRELGSEHPDTLASMNNLAANFNLEGDFSSARKLIEESLSILKRVMGPEHPDTLTAIHNLAATLYHERELSEAQRLFEGVITSRARLKRAGRHQPSSYIEAVAFHYLGLIHRDSKNTPKARVFFLRALDLLEAQAGQIDISENVKTLFRARFGKAYRDAIAASLDLEYLGEAFRTLERYRAQSLLTLLAQRRLAFAAIPHKLEVQRREIAARYDAIYRELNYLKGATLENKKNDIASKISGLQAEKTELRRQREVVEGQIREALFQDRENYPRSLNSEEVRQILDPGTLMLSYSVGEDSTKLFVLSQSHKLEVYALPIEEDTLRKQVANFNKLLKHDRCLESPEASIRMGQWLYEEILQPAAERVAASDRLLIIPDGPLHDLPFAALAHKIAAADHGWQYLVEWKPLHTVVSATAYAELLKCRLQQCPTQEASTYELVAFGDPNYPVERSIKPKVDPCRESEHLDGKPKGREVSESIIARSAVSRGLFGGLERLPHSGQEVAAIGRLFPEGAARTYLLGEASEERAKAEISKARIVHFAVHGLFDHLTPFDSFLAFSPPDPAVADQRDNGFLQAWEIYQGLHLDADLVVLSACETARGPLHGGEGIISLSRAFQVAGARTVAATLWKVADESSAELMIRFYRHLLSGMAKDEALRAAQLELIRGPVAVLTEDGERVERDFTAPYHWGAFQLIGDWQ